MPLANFDPLIQRWFQERFAAATEAQRLGWAAIQQGRDTLIAAPTGSGKTLTAFLAGIDRLLRLALGGELCDQTYIVYVSPLRALSNDIQRNLEGPLKEILALARLETPACQEIRAQVRTGDTPAKERQQMVRKPPHILVTTPESLYLLLTGKRSREILRSVETVIVDEIHSVARDKRGSHLALSLERLDNLCESRGAGGSPALQEDRLVHHQSKTLGSGPGPSGGRGPVLRTPVTPRAAGVRSTGPRPPLTPRLRCDGALASCTAEICPSRPVRIGLSATQKPLEDLARFLVGTGAAEPAVVDVGHFRDMDIAAEVPNMELQAVCTHEHWAEVYERLVQLIGEHRSTLIFVNTRKLAERVAHQLSERLGEDQVLSHHGSLSHKSRQRTEQRLKEGSLKAVVATASLELGIDVGHIGLVCQLGTPRSIAVFLQRVGRSGHSLGLVPKGRLFALSREELIECLALIRAVRAGRLDRVEIPRCPLDILAQQIVAAVACDDWDEDALFAMCRRASPFSDLQRSDYEAVLEMLSEGIAPRRGRWGAYLHRDRVNRRLRARKGARLTAIMCGGAIPEIADYRVVTDDENRTVVGSVDEDFAVESNAGDIFLLGNTSWRIKHVRGGEVVVTDAHGAPPSIPFWRGEAPGRTVELSAEVGRLREDIVAIMQDEAGAPNRVSGRSTFEDSDERGAGTDALRPLMRFGSPTSSSPAVTWLEETCGVNRHGAEQALNYVNTQYQAAGMVPTQKRLLFERFFDESGGMQLVIHAPFGTRINRAWGLAMRKRFCRSFDFELQASADDNGIVLSLGAQHSFPLEQMFKLVPSRLAEGVLIQAFLAVPFFTTRWRWNVTRALQMKRAMHGKRVPPHLQRMRADDLLSAVFPAQTACQENVTGDIEVPDQPIVRQTVHDCLQEASDLQGLLKVLEDIESGAVELVSLDSREPSPFAHQLLNANPYAFLDDAPLEERRARAVTLRRTLSTEALSDLGRLDPEAIALVRSEAWPLVRDADELHDALLSLGALPAGNGEAWQGFFAELRSAGRATEVHTGLGPLLWVATERRPLTQAIWPESQARPEVSVPAGVRQDWPREESLAFLVRGRMECAGPTTAAILARELGLNPSEVEGALLALENEGVVLRGHFTANAAGAPEQEWCDRRLLARIHRLTLEGLRRQIAPVPFEQFVRFLIRHQHAHAQTMLRGQPGLLTLIEQLEGFEAPAGHWEKYLLPARIEAYSPGWLDGLTFFGQAGWGRLRPALAQTPGGEGRGGKVATISLPGGGEAIIGSGRPMKAMTQSTPITLYVRDHLGWLLPEAAADSPENELALEFALSGNAHAAYQAFLRHGALFPAQLATLLQLLPSQVDNVLGELAAAGLVTSDGYPALRTLLGVKTGGLRRSMGNRRRLERTQAISAGRWTLLRSPLTPAVPGEERTVHWCRLLLRRYGVMFRDLLANESSAPPWSSLVRAYRRLEARGEVRGGRFVAGVAGEQYALTEVVPALRLAAAEADDRPLTLPATDPLNFTGRVGPESRVPALPGRIIRIVEGRVTAQAEAPAVV